MGALHDGHRSLFRAARAENDIVVASLFVNPAQFDEAADLAAYPRDEERDAAIAAEAGVDVLFAPAPTRSTRPASRPGSTSRSGAGALDGTARPAISGASPPSA